MNFNHTSTSAAYVARCVVCHQPISCFHVDFATGTAVTLPCGHTKSDE